MEKEGRTFITVAIGLYGDICGVGYDKGHNTYLLKKIGQPWKPTNDTIAKECIVRLQCVRVAGSMVGGS